MHSTFRKAPYDYLQIGDHVLYHPYGGHNRSVSGLGIIRGIISSAAGDGDNLRRDQLVSPRYVIENCKSRQMAAYHVEDILRKVDTK